jgi:hypothetical protein
MGRRPTSRVCAIGREVERQEDIPEAAVKALIQLRTHTRKFAPELAKLYLGSSGDEQTHLLAGDVLQGLGPDAATAVPALVKSLRQSKDSPGHDVIPLLAAIGPAAHEALPELRRQCTGSPWNNVIVAEALWKIGRLTNEVVTIYVRILEQPQQGPDAQAFERLAEMGEAAEAAVPCLRGLLFDAPRSSTRLGAERALRRISPTTFEPLAVEVNRIARDRMLRILDALGSQGVWEATPARTDFFRALHCMAAQGREAREAVPRLVELLSTPPPVAQNREEATWLGLTIPFMTARALGEIGEASESVVVALTNSLRSTNLTVVRACCEALGNLGPAAEKSVPALTAVLDSPWPMTRLEAAMALVAIAPRSTNAVLAALSGLGAEARFQPYVEAARWRLQRGRALPFSTPMFEILRISGEDARIAGYLGPAAREYLPTLIDRALRFEGYLALPAALAIRRIDPVVFKEIGLPGVLALPDTPGKVAVEK